MEHLAQTKVSTSADGRAWASLGETALLVNVFHSLSLGSEQGWW